MFNRENQFFPGKPGHPIMKPSVSGPGVRSVNPSQRVIPQPFDPRILGDFIQPAWSGTPFERENWKYIPCVLTPDSNIDKLERHEKDKLNDRLKQTPYYPRGDGSIEPKDQKNKDKNPPRPSNNPYSV